MIDPRRGLPSASQMERLALCPGSLALSRKAPPQPESEDAASGTRIHAAWAGEAAAEATLSGPEVETLDRLRELEVRAIRTVFGARAADRVVREQRLWIRDFHRDLLSGQPDVIVSVGDDHLVLDGKTGRNETPIAAANLQLRALAELWDEETLRGATSITVGILAPWQDQPITLARYERAHLDAAREEVLRVLLAASREDAPRNPSEPACRYCQARAICPEAREAALTLPEPALAAAVERTQSGELTPERFAELLPAEMLASCLVRGELFDRIHAAIRGEARRRLIAGEPVPGWRLKEGQSRRSVTDVGAVFSRVNALGVSQADFLSAVKVTLGDLEEAIRKATGTKGKGLRAQMDQILAGCVEMKQASASLEKV